MSVCFTRDLLISQRCLCHVADGNLRHRLPSKTPPTSEKCFSTWDLSEKAASRTVSALQHLSKNSRTEQWH